jgi:hypothetical protein
VANLRGEANFLEQAVFVDQIGEESARALSQVGVAAWKVAMREVMASAQHIVLIGTTHPRDFDHACPLGLIRRRGFRRAEIPPVA